MKKVRLKELNINTRKDMIIFLKRLWDGESTLCPICKNELEPLHKKAKKSNIDWQCKSCDKIYKTIHLLDELNERDRGVI